MFTITNLIKNVGLSDAEKLKKARDEKIEKALQSSLDKLRCFLKNDAQETIKFSTNAYIRAKIHDFCDETGGADLKTVHCS